jgi:hypothetical protein
MVAAEATGGAASPRIESAVREDLPGIFPRFGFRPIGRAEVPEDVRGSVEFVSACPERARAMAAELV